MTYIMFETVPSNDPRLVPEIKVIGSDWHFSFAQVLGTPVIDWLKPTTITEDMYHARHFTNALNGEVGKWILASVAEFVLVIRSCCHLGPIPLLPRRIRVSST